jgi:hypothetical protein
MRVWTVHLPPGAAPASVPSTAKPKAAPVLLREGFAFWALVFGPLWLLRHGCWLGGLAAGALMLAGGTLLPAPLDLAVLLGVHVMLGLHGQDVRRWTLRRRGWKLMHVVLGTDEEGAMVRLLDQQPRLGSLFMERDA